MFDFIPLLYLKTARDFFILLGIMFLLILFIVVCVDNQQNKIERQNYTGARAIRLLLPVLFGSMCVLVGAWCGVESARTEISYEEIWEIDAVIEDKDVLQCILTTADGSEYVANVTDVTGNITTGEANNRGYAEIITYVHPLVDGSPAVSKMNLYINIDG